MIRPALEDRVADLEHQVATLTAALALGPDDSRHVPLRDVAQAVGKSLWTLRGWIRDREAWEREQLGELLLKSGNAWVSTPKRIRAWRHAREAQQPAPRASR